MDFYPKDAPKNFLFRGNMPISNNTFAYDILVRTLNSSASNKNVTLSKDFSILDVRLVNGMIKTTALVIHNDNCFVPALQLFECF